MLDVRRRYFIQLPSIDRFGEKRPPGNPFNLDANATLAALIVLNLLAYNLARGAKHRFVKHGFYAIIKSTIVVVLGRPSRGVFLAGVVMSPFPLLKSPQKIVLGPLVSVAIPIAWRYLPAQYLAPILRHIYGDTESEIFCGYCAGIPCSATLEAAYSRCYS